MPFKTKEEKRRYDRERYKKADKLKVMEHRREYYQKNREVILARTRAWTLKRLAKHRQIVMDAKAVPCMDCNKRYHYCAMDFDHRPTEIKGASISYLMNNWKVSEKALLDEMAKCDVVCSNCHRMRTFERMNDKNEKPVHGGEPIHGLSWGVEKS